MTDAVKIAVRGLKKSFGRKLVLDGIDLDVHVGESLVVIGGSGNGEQIAANKIRGVRAALAWSEETARLARLHNDANVLSIGAREQPIEQAVTFAQVFVGTAFSGAPRHARRLAMIADYEKTGELPPLPSQPAGGPALQP